MPYCTIATLQELLPKTITIGDTTVVNESLNKPNADTISIKEARRYIHYASQEIDAKLRAIYECPLRRIKVFETTLAVNLLEGKDVITVGDACNFNTGAWVRIKDTISTDTYEVIQTFDEPNNTNTMKLERGASRSYLAIDAPAVSLLAYPDPIPFICARIAIASIIDREFAAEQSPDISTFGKTQRNNAGVDIDLILTGNIRLSGQEHTGRRFARMSVMNIHSSPAPIQPGTMKE